jgi:hypothetical protein
MLIEFDNKNSMGIFLDYIHLTFEGGFFYYVIWYQ